MNISELIEEVEALGIELSPEEDQLRFRAPKGVMTGDLKKRLSAGKAEILEYLLADANRTIEPDSVARLEPFPLTEAQTAYFLGRHGAYDLGGLDCRGFLEIAWPGHVTADQVTHAWQAILQRHDMLRAVIEDEGWQRVLPYDAFAMPVPVRDLGAMDTQDVRKQLDTWRDEMMRTPVDYATDPLVQARICRSRHQTHILLAIELILVDSTSLYLVINELIKLVDGPDAVLPDLELTFRDYVIADRSRKSRHGYRRDRAYWSARLDSLPPAPELPQLRDLPLPGRPECAGFRRRSFDLNPSQLKQLSQAASSLGTTVNVALIGAFSETLGLWSKTGHFLLNLPIFRRDQVHPQVNSIVGDFTSVTLLEVDLTKGVTFGDRLRAIGNQLFDDLDHTEFSGLEVLAELSRQQGAPVLMPVVFTSTLGNQSDDTVAGTAPTGSVVQGLTQTPQVSIDCQVVERGDGTQISWDVREEIFPEGLIEDAFETFKALVFSMSDDSAKVSGLLSSNAPLKLPAAQAETRQEMNSTAKSAEPKLIHEALWRRTERDPDRTAIIDRAGSMNFGDLRLEALKLAGGLKKAGCRPGDRIAILCEKGRLQAIAPLAVLLCGGCYVPIDVDQPPARRNAIFENAGIHLVVTDRDCELPEGVCKVEAAEALAAHEVATVSPSSLAYVIYTSGSTGTPKGVAISHQAAWNTIQDITTRFDIGGNDRVLAVASLGFDLSVYDLFGVPAEGGILIYPEEGRKADPSHWADLVRRHSVTLWNTIPAQLQMLLDAAGASPRGGTSLRLAMVSGDWAPLGLKDRLDTSFPGTRLISLGGATEASIWSVFHEIDQINPHWSSVPYGKPLANQSLRVVDARLMDRPDWSTGQIVIGGEGLASGYFNDPEKTEAQFVLDGSGERFYLTGDLGRCWPDGTIEFLGRQDTQVKIRGHRIELGEIAANLALHASVSDAQALVTAGPGQSISAFVETAPGRQSLATEAFAQMKKRAVDLENDLQGDTFRQLMEGADKVAILAMAAQLRSDGLFRTPEQRHDLTQIYKATGVAEVHRRLLRRWLDGLLAAGVLSKDSDGQFHGLIEATPEDVKLVWEDVDRLEQKTGYGSDTLHYVRTCADRLSGLLQGTVDVRELLFPKGEMETAQAAYRDNLVSRTMNGIVVAAVRAFAERQAEGPLRVLEVGAGVAGTATDLVPALAEYEPEYWFTDLSEFFLTSARRQFSDYPWMRYGIFDMNEDARAQGVQQNSFDIILCANVLHNATHAGDVLKQLSHLLAPGGCVIFIEPFRRHNYPLLVSMEFFPELTGFKDLRTETDQTFFTRDQWITWLEDAGAELTDCAPSDDGPLASAGQGVFIGQFKCGRAAVRPTDLRNFVAQCLPAYMVPERIVVLDTLPRLRNGKADRKTLQDWCNATQDDSSLTQAAATEPRTDLERKIADIWAEVLDLETVSCEADFYAQGGDSLLLSRMIARLRQAVPEAAQREWEVLLRHLLREPKIRSLATWLQAGGKTEGTQDLACNPVVPLWGDVTRAETVCVLVHAGTGNLAPYQALLSALDKSLWSAGIGLELPSLDMFTSLPAEQALSELATCYADAIGDGTARLTLIGYCLGGLLATEIARILTERGRDVEELVAVSSYRPPLVKAPALTDYVFAQAMGTDLGTAGLPEEPALAAAVASALKTNPGMIEADAFVRLQHEHPHVHERFARWMDLPEATRLSRIVSAAAGDGLYYEGGGDELLKRQYALFTQSMTAVGRYEALPWMGRCLLLRNSASDPLLPGTPQDVETFWQDICLGDLTVQNIPGDHFSCLSASNAHQAAKRIAEYVVEGRS